MLPEFKIKRYSETKPLELQQDKNSTQLSNSIVFLNLRFFTLCQDVTYNQRNVFEGRGKVFEFLAISALSKKLRNVAP